jgi:hypothetical protein
MASVVRIPIVIHGLMGIFPFISAGTRNADKLIDALKGTDSRDFIQAATSSVWAYILEMQRLHGKIELIFVVHSMGCYRAIQIAEKCRRQGILVRYIAAIDPTAINRMFGMTPMVVPENVMEVDEFWASSGIPAMNRKLDPSGGKGGCYRYYPDWEGKKWQKEYNTGHIALASNRLVVSRIVKRVEALLQ